MNPFAYRTTGLAIKTLSNLSKAKVNLHGQENIPAGAKIFVVNHFTRLETLLLPYYLHKLLKVPIWSLAAHELFVGALGRFLESVGAVSTQHPDRDKLIIKTLLTNEAGWIIFPEGRMVKSKKIIEKGRYMVASAGGSHPPHTGAAYLALRTEFYRQRLLLLEQHMPAELHRLLPRFNLETPDAVNSDSTLIVPVNITYYPLRARINILNKLANRLVEELPERATEELMTEGSMLLSGVDIDINFGTPIKIADYLQHRTFLRDLRSAEPLDFSDPLPSAVLIRKTALKITQRYMRAIYSMTTVNHDHIFASLLKYSPRNRIRLLDIKRRAFLAVTQTASKLPIHRHHSLLENQNHLLIDDCYRKVADFLEIAQEKGVVSVAGDVLLRQRPKLKTIFDFHRARIDNPVAVMANEVEPLTHLQKKISRLSWTPAWLLRKKLKKWFLSKAKREFESDYNQFFIPEESKPKKIGAPFLLRGRRRQVGIVLSHGYMAAPEEVRALADYLNQRGFWVYGLRLPGHGTSPEDLATRTYHDWIRAMEDGYLLMRSMCERVILGGFSTGAALALELATRVTDAFGVFAISTPLRLQYFFSRLAPMVHTWNRLMERVNLTDAKREFVENKSENPQINYTRNPISGVRELERLMAFLEPKLEQIKLPALVVQSSRDPVVNPRGSERIFHLLGSDDKQYVVVNLKRHNIIRGEGAEMVYQTVAQFVANIAESPASKLPLSATDEEQENGNNS